MYFSIRLFSLRYISGVILSLLPILSHAQNNITDQATNSGQASTHEFQIKVGALYTWIDSNLDISKNNVNQSNIDYESDLNLDEQTLNPSLEASWTYNERHYFAFNFFSLRREAQKTLSEEINIGEDITFEADAAVNSYLNTDFYQFSYGYDFLESERWALGASIGLHLVNIETEIKSNTSNLNNERQVAYQDTSLPLPNVGLFTHYQLSKNGA